MYLCVRGIDISPFYDFDLRTVPTVWHLFVFHLTVELTRLALKQKATLYMSTALLSLPVDRENLLDLGLDLFI